MFTLLPLRPSLLLALAFTLCLPRATGRHDGGDLVNAVLGNASMENAPACRDDIRIRAHLETVLIRLTRSDASFLSPALRAARARNLDRLRDYACAGIFPQRPASIPWRTPNFMDDRGVLCAVGYLFEADCGTDAVLEITKDHRLDYVPYIDSHVLAEWQAASGLSRVELAMIQPTYGGEDEGEGDDYDTFLDTNNNLSDDDLIVSMLIFGDIAASIVNVAESANGKGHASAGVLGMIMGAASMMLGFNDERDGLAAAGTASFVFGVASLAVSLTQHAPDPPATVTAQPFVGDVAGETRTVGVMASIRF